MLQDRGETVQFDEVKLGKLGDALLALLAELQPHDAGVRLVAGPTQQACALRTVRETHDAVVSGVQVLRRLADRGPLRIVVTLDGEEQLMLGLGQADAAGLLVAPTVEPAQRRAEGQEVRVIAGRERGHGRNIVRRVDCIATRYECIVRRYERRSACGKT